MAKSVKCDTALSLSTIFAICARGAAMLEKARAELSAIGVDAITYQMDTSDAGAAEKCAEYASTLGK